MTKRLHLIAIPDDSLTRNASRIRRNIVQQGVIAGDTSVAESISLEPGERPIVGTFRGLRASMLAQMVEELFDAPGIDAVVYFDPDSDSPDDGYYALRNVDVEPFDPRESDLAQFDGAMLKTGTQESHWRAVRTTPENVSSRFDFGTDENGLIGIDGQSTQVQWFDPVGKEFIAPTATNIINVDNASIEQFDTETPSFTRSNVNPVLIYRLDYDREGIIETRLYDDRGNADKTDGNGNIQWQSVYRPTHDYIGNPVTSNKILRLYFDTANNSLTAEEWNNGTTSWDSLSLGTSDWQLFAVDFTHIGLARVYAQVTFEDSTNNDLFRLDMRFHRGVKFPQWIVPPDETFNSGTTPSGLQTLLNPVANNDEIFTAARAGLVEKQETRL